MNDYTGNVVASHFLEDEAGASPPTFPFTISPSLTSSYIEFLFNLTTIQEHSPYKEASQHELWVKAMDAELEALEANHTWDLVPLPFGKLPIGCKWVYKVKLTSTGTVERYKAWLVANGYNQVHGVDYDQLFSPVANLASVRFLIAMAAIHGWHLNQMDVNNTFLHDFLHETIYMQPPQGYKKARTGEVCKLVKSLYGLKQASREWNYEFNNKLLSQGFISSLNDPCLFLRGSGDQFICLVVYVDDVLITSPSLPLIQELKHFLHATFTIKDLGEAQYFLGMNC